MTRQKRFLGMLLAAMLAFAVLFSVAYVAEEVNHDCSGAGCAVCQQLSMCEDLLKTVGGAALAAGVMAAAFSRVCGRTLPGAECTQSNTLISLKVKLSD